MTRRQLLAGLLASPAFAALDRSRLTVIADETGSTVPDWIAFARKFKLRNVELRAITQNGHPVMLDSMPAADLKQIAGQLRSEGIGVSFLNSALLKYTLPGTQAVRKEDWYEQLYKRQNLTAQKLYDTRDERLKRAIDAAQALGAPMLRSFTFWRVKEPRLLFPRLVDLLGEMGKVAESAGCRLLIETEYATNIATSEEIRDLLSKLPSKAIGINWDPQNSYDLEPDVFPGGYAKLPLDRVWNVQIKAEGLFGKKRLDWGAIMRRMSGDGYSGLFGLETHHGHGPENYKMSHRAMDELLRLTA